MTESHGGDNTSSGGSVAEEISGRPSEVATSAREDQSQLGHRGQLVLDQAQKNEPPKDATAEPLLAEQQDQDIQLHPIDPTIALPVATVALSTKQWQWCLFFGAVLIIGMVAIITLLAVQYHSGRHGSSSSSANRAAVTAVSTPLSDAAATRSLVTASTAAKPWRKSTIKTLSFALTTSNLPACQEDSADRSTQKQRSSTSTTATATSSAVGACVTKAKILLRGSSTLPVGPFVCSSKTTAVCRQVATRSAQNRLQVMLSGIYKIRAQVTLECQSQEQQPIILVLMIERAPIMLDAPNGYHQNENHQACQAGKIQTLHTAAIVDLKAGDAVSLKLMFPATTTDPVEVKVLVMRASSQMTWEVQQQHEE